MKKNNKKHSSMTIYFDEHKKCFQIITPNSKHFNGDWTGLAHSITYGNHYSIKLN